MNVATPRKILSRNITAKTMSSQPQWIAPKELPPRVLLETWFDVSKIRDDIETRQAKTEARRKLLSVFGTWDNAQNKLRELGIAK